MLPAVPGRTEQRLSQGCSSQAGCWGPESKGAEVQWGFACVIGVIGMGQALFVIGYQEMPGAARGRRKIKKD